MPRFGDGENLLQSNYAQMTPDIEHFNAENIKFLNKIDNIKNKIDDDELRKNFYTKDDNGNNILHRLIINSLNEDELIKKIQLIPGIENLINTINLDKQTPLHLLCQYQYFETYKLIKNKLMGIENKEDEDEINDLFDELNGIHSVHKKKENIKPSNIKINYLIMDKKSRIPLSLLIKGVDIQNIDKIKNHEEIIYQERKIMPLINAITNTDKNKKEYKDFEYYNLIYKIFDNKNIKGIIINNNYLLKYINLEFFNEYINNIDNDKLKSISNKIFVDFYKLNNFIKYDNTENKFKLREITEKQYYYLCSDYILNKLFKFNNEYGENIIIKRILFYSIYNNIIQNKTDNYNFLIEDDSVDYILNDIREHRIFKYEDKDIKYIKEQIETKNFNENDENNLKNKSIITKERLILPIDFYDETNIQNIINKITIEDNNIKYVKDYTYLLYDFFNDLKEKTDDNIKKKYITYFFYNINQFFYDNYNDIDINENFYFDELNYSLFINYIKFILLINNKDLFILLKDNLLNNIRYDTYMCYKFIQTYLYSLYQNINNDDFKLKFNNNNNIHIIDYEFLQTANPQEIIDTKFLLQTSKQKILNLCIITDAFYNNEKDINMKKKITMFKFILLNALYVYDNNFINIIPNNYDTCENPDCENPKNIKYIFHNINDEDHNIKFNLTKFKVDDKEYELPKNKKRNQDYHDNFDKNILKFGNDKKLYELIKLNDHEKDINTGDILKIKMDKEENKTFIIYINNSMYLNKKNDKIINFYENRENIKNMFIFRFLIFCYNLYNTIKNDEFFNIKCNEKYYIQTNILDFEMKDFKENNNIYLIQYLFYNDLIANKNDRDEHSNDGENYYNKKKYNVNIEGQAKDFNYKELINIVNNQSDDIFENKKTYINNLFMK